MVSAKVDIVCISNMSNPDLFWALRGGGGTYRVIINITFNTFAWLYLCCG